MHEPLSTLTFPEEERELRTNLAFMEPNQRLRMQQDYDKYFQGLQYVVGEFYVLPIAKISLLSPQKKNPNQATWVQRGTANQDKIAVLDTDAVGFYACFWARFSTILLHPEAFQPPNSQWEQAAHPYHKMTARTMTGCFLLNKKEACSQQTHI